MARYRIHPDVARVLISEARIHRRVTELARKITRCYQDAELSIIGVLNGSVTFLGELLRQLPMPTRLDCVAARSYGVGTTSSGRISIHRQWRLSLRNRHVLLVDDILDTGRTLRRICEQIHKEKPASLRACVLLDKPSRRVVPLKADFVGFNLPDEFVVGYGLDFAERYRNLPYIAVLKPEIYRQPQRKTNDKPTSIP